MGNCTISNIQSLLLYEGVCDAPIVLSSGPKYSIVGTLGRLSLLPQDTKYHQELYLTQQVSVDVQAHRLQF